MPILLIGLLFLQPVFAQEENPAVLLNHYLLRCPAHASGFRGDVNIELSISKDGFVENFSLIETPDVLVAEVQEIIDQLRFTPAQKEGVAVTSKTVITLHFGDEEHENTEVDNEIIIYEETPDMEDTSARTTMTTKDIVKESSIEIADVIDKVAGVQQAQGAGNISKPIIRGHQERRMLILVDGVRHESQKWGIDHGTEIDSFAADSISVIRGANGARYGPDAIGGVVLVKTPDMLEIPGVAGAVRSGFFSNGYRGFGAARVDWKPNKDTPSLRLEGNYTQNASLSTPKYVLGNTASQLWNVGLAVQHQWNNWRIQLRARHYALNAGIFFGQKVHTPREFEEQLNVSDPSYNWKTTYEIERSYQDVTHDMIQTYITGDLGDWGYLDITYAYQHNLREEYDHARKTIENSQYKFILRTHSLDTHAKHHAVNWNGLWLEGGLGLQSTFQENVYMGLALIPNYRSFSGGVFLHERLSFEGVDIEFASRYDALSRATYLSSLNWEQHLRRDSLQEDDCYFNVETDVAKCEESHQTATVSLGSVVHIIPEHLNLKLNLSSASRFPNMDELYINGTVPSIPIFALGNPSAGIETTYGFSTSLAASYPNLQAEISGFYNHIDQYIYFAPLLNPDGNLAYDVTLQGAFPRFGYQPTQATFWGLDGQGEFFPTNNIGIGLQAATIRAYNQDTGEHLIGIPADRGSLSLILRHPQWNLFSDIEVSCTGEMVTQQHRVAPEADFAPPPAEYTLLHLYASTQFTAFPDLTAHFAVRNVFNTAYREYNSMLRYFADQPGRDIRFHLDYAF